MNTEECMASAETALEDADDNIKRLVADMRGRLIPSTVEENVAVINAQISLGQAWRDLAALKTFETEK